MENTENNSLTYAVRKRRRGDRRTGRLLRSLDPYNGFTPFIMRTRGDSSIYYEDDLDLGPAEAYIRKKRDEGLRGFGMLHLFVTAYLRVISQRPGLNRFVAGQRIYARNCIEVVMSVKTRMAADAPESSIKVRFGPCDSPETVYEKMNEQIAQIKNAEATSTDKVAASLLRLPRFLLRFAMSMIRFLDYHDMLPKVLLEASPFHASLVVTDLGSLGISPVYHHLYNFGDAPLFLAFGTKRREYVLNRDGQPEEKRFMRYRLTVDERICDGFYLASTLKYLKAVIRTPERLDQPPETLVEDID